MTASIRVLTTSALDSSPSLLIVSPNGSKTLINCGEGCQRSFLESSSKAGVGSLRVSSVNRICLTHIDHHAVGGLPGMILTTADVAEAAAIEFRQQQQQQHNGKKSSGEEQHHKRKASFISNEGIPDLEIVGPAGTKSFLHSLRHFMRRDRFNVHAYEGQFDSSKLNDTSSHRHTLNKRAKKKMQKDNEDTSFTVESIPVSYTPISNNNGTTPKQAVSYVFTTPPIPGKFLIEKARELKVPMGPLCGQLKAGNSVTFIDPDTNEERTVQSTDVVAKASPGVGVAVVYCPTKQVFDELKSCTIMRSFEKNSMQESTDDTSSSVQLDAIVHLTPKTIFESDTYQSWCERFESGVDHVTLHVAESIEERAATDNPSPFVSAMRGGVRRSFVDCGLFPMPEIPTSDDNKGLPSSSTFIEGCPMMEYILMPRSKRGLNIHTMDSLYSTTEMEDLEREEQTMDALKLAETIKRSIPVDPNGNDGSKLGELIFTGTGSAVPCKHRNVTGMYLRMNNGNSMLLDVGEGTVGQLLQSWKSTTRQTTSSTLVNEYHSRIQGIKAVWISHPHADHHLGLLRLLSERSAICGSNDPITLMAPPNMFAFLAEYQLVVPEIKGSYVELDCRDLSAGHQESPLCSKLLNELGIRCTSVQVTHCPYSYAVIIDGTSFGRLAYSGDCRPSSRFAATGIGADVLIHEATFEDGMKEEAVLKKHSTVGEAIDIKRKMNAKTLILTHFSQRYPKIPPLKLNESSDTDDAIAFAFDFMRVTPKSIPLATKMTPALRLLYPGEDDTTVEPSSMEDSKDLLAVPGMFSAPNVL